MPHTFEIYGTQSDPEFREFLNESLIEYMDNDSSVIVVMSYHTDLFLLGYNYAQWKIRKAIGL